MTFWTSATELSWGRDGASVTSSGREGHQPHLRTVTRGTRIASPPLQSPHSSSIARPGAPKQFLAAVALRPTEQGQKEHAWQQELSSSCLGKVAAPISVSGPYSSPLLLDLCPALFSTNLPLLSECHSPVLEPCALLPPLPCRVCPTCSLELLCHWEAVLLEVLTFR